MSRKPGGEGGSFGPPSIPQALQKKRAAENGEGILRLLRELVRWSAIFALWVALVPTLALCAVLNLWAKLLLALADVLADAVEGLR